MTYALLTLFSVIGLLSLTTLTIIYRNISFLPGGFGHFDANSPDKIATGHPDFPHVDLSAYTVSDYSTVSFPSPVPNRLIRGWHLVNQASPETIVLILAGYRQSRKDALALSTAGMLHQAGYSVALIDFLNQGDSDRSTGRTTLGVAEHRDVMAGIRWCTQMRYKKIGILGISLGASSALLAVGNLRNPGIIRAMWLDSPFANRTKIVAAGLKNKRLPGWLAKPVLYTGSLLSGERLLDHQPIDAIKPDYPPLAIVHNQHDGFTAYQHSDAIAHRAHALGVPVTTWFPTHAGHCTLLYQETEAYKNRLVSFFKQHI